MISAAWVSAALFALPQTIVWRELRHPKDPNFKQCTTIGFFDKLLLRSSSTDNNTIHETIKEYNTSDPASYIISPVTAEKLYSSLFLFAVYIVPLSVIIVTYANILNKLYRKRNIEKKFDSARRNHRNTSPTTTSSDRERPPTYLIRCLTLFRSSVKQERLKRGLASENVHDNNTGTHESHTGEHSQALLSTDTTCNNPIDKKRETDLNHSQEVHNGKKKSSSNFSALLKREECRDNPTRVRQTKRFSLSPLALSRAAPHSLVSSTSSLSNQKNQSVRCSASKTNSSNLTALRMCAIQVLAFIVCWTPYTSISLWHIIGKYTMWNREFILD